MSDIDRIGGIPVVLKALLDNGMLHGACLTVTGRTMEKLRALAPPAPDGSVIRPVDEPLHQTGGLTTLHGSLARRRGREERQLRGLGHGGGRAGVL